MSWLDQFFAAEPVSDGYLSITISTSIVLSSTQYAKRLLNFAGTLGAPGTITMPFGIGPNGATLEWWAVINSTNQSLTFIGASGTGVTLPSGTRAIVGTDGTNYFALSPIGTAPGAFGTLVANALELLTGGIAFDKANAAVAITHAAKTAITTAQAGTNHTWSCQDATAGSSVAGAAAGGGYTWTAGDAKRLTSGNADGGGFTYNLGAGIGTGAGGNFTIRFSAATLLQVQSNGAVMWGKSVNAPSYYHEAQTTDVACTDTYFISQTPWASATGTNRNPGNILVQVPSPAAGGAAGEIKLSVSGTPVVRLSAAAIGFFNGAPAAKQTITGALSTVTDAAAKAVLTSIIAALVQYGMVQDGTT